MVKSAGRTLGKYRSKDCQTSWWDLRLVAGMVSWWDLRLVAGMVRSAGGTSS
jgi:hypothetical protein